MTGIAIHFGVWGGGIGHANLSRVLGDAASLGYTHVVLPLRYCSSDGVRDMARLFEEAGIRPLNSGGVPGDQSLANADSEIRRRGIDHLKQSVRLARDIGSDQISGVLYGALAKAARPASSMEMLASAEALSEVAEFAQTCGVKLAIEVVNRYESNLINTVDQALDYLAVTDHPNIFLHLDTFHMSIEEADPIAAVKRALPRLAYFELCQSHRGDLLEGSLDLGGRLREVLDLGYTGRIGVEAFARDGLPPDHADMLAIWRNPFPDGSAVARRAFTLITEARAIQR